MVNSRAISDLHPCLQRGCNELIKRLKSSGYQVLVTQTLRDSEYQNYLYAQGRTRPGSVVTNAKGGSSMHNYGLAFDICQNIKGKEYANDKLFADSGQIWTEMGGVWGGNFKSIKDTPHFEFTGGLTLKELQAAKKPPIDIKMKWELEKERDDEVVTVTTAMINGKPIKIERIFKDGFNYIKIDSLKKAGLKVGYDANTKMVSIDFK